MRATHIIIAGLVCASAISARAQDATKTEDLPSTHKVVYFGDGSQTTTEDTNSLINIFYEDQFRHAQDPRAPYFLLMSRDSKIAMGVGGKAQGNLAYDFDGSIDGTNFLPYKIAVPRDAANPTSFQASVAETAVFFTVFGRSKLGNYIVNVEGKFSERQTLSCSRKPTSLWVISPLVKINLRFLTPRQCRQLWKRKAPPELSTIVRCFCAIC